MKSRRYLHIDILRTFALLMMVQTHFMEYLTPEESDYSWLYNSSVWGFWGIISAPLFSFLLGVSYWLWLQKSESNEMSGFDITKISWFRGIFIFIFGLFFCVSIWLPDQIFSWDILTFLGVSLILLSILRKAPSWLFIPMILAVLAISPTFRELTNYASHWEDHEYVYDFTLYDGITGFLSHGYFGLLPWVIYPLAGYAFGKCYYSEETDMRINGVSAGILGLVLIIIGFTGVYLGDALPNFTGEMTFYPASTTYLVAYLGICILSSWLLYHWVDKKETANPKHFLFFSLYGKYSLTIYYLHHAIHIWPIYLLAYLEGQEEIDYYYGDFVSPPVALGLALGFVIIFYYILKLWDKCHGKLSLEWIMHKVINKIS